RSDAGIAQEEASPYEDAEIDAKENMAEERGADPKMGSDRATHIAGQKDRAEHGSSREGVERGAGQSQQTQSSGQSRRRRIAEVGGRFDDHLQGHEFHPGIKQHEGDDKA